MSITVTDLISFNHSSQFQGQTLFKIDRIWHKSEIKSLERGQFNYSSISLCRWAKRNDFNCSSWHYPRNNRNIPKWNSFFNRVSTWIERNKGPFSKLPVTDCLLVIYFVNRSKNKLKYDLLQNSWFILTASGSYRKSILAYHGNGGHSVSDLPVIFKRNSIVPDTRLFYMNLIL